jgi:hypothetical protein
MPAIVIVLSLLGLVPFVFFVLVAAGYVPFTAAQHMLVSLTDYAALILAFAGGVHWGLALAPGAERPVVRFGVGVLPLIIAWVGLVMAQMVAPWLGLVVLILGYLATVLTEHRAAQRLLVPSHYVLIRWGFSIGAMAMMVMVLVLSVIRQTTVF